MPLTTAQATALKADILASPDLAAAVAAGNNQAVAAAYNAVAAPDYLVLQTAAPVGAINDGIKWNLLTPSDAPDGTQAWANRSLCCQGKQFNLQLMLQGAQTTINATRASVRSGLQDALQNVPSGNNGSLKDAGWANVFAALQRTATRAEKLFAAATANGVGTRGSAANPDTLTFEGAISNVDVAQALSS